MGWRGPGVGGRFKRRSAGNFYRGVFAAGEFGEVRIMKSVKNLFLGTLLTALVFTGCDQGLGVSGGGLPALTGAAAISGTLQVDETLTAEFTPSEGQAAAVDLLEKHYQWQRKAAAEDAAWANIDEAVSAVYTLAPDDEGKYIQVLVTVTGYGGAVTGSREETVAQGGPVSTPTAHPPAGEVDSGSPVTLSTGTTGATIHYTTDGGTPTAASAQYTSAIPITAATTIKAIAVKAGRADSGMLTAAYTIVAPGTVAQPSADPPAGAVNSGKAASFTTGCMAIPILSRNRTEQLCARAMSSLTFLMMENPFSPSCRLKKRMVSV